MTSYSLFQLSVYLFCSEFTEGYDDENQSSDTNKSWASLWSEWALDTTMHGIRYFALPTVWRSRMYVNTILI